MAPGLARVRRAAGYPFRISPVEERLPKSKPRRRLVLSMLPGLAVAVACFVLYLKTLAPTVLYYDPRGFYDAAMLQVRAYLLDIPNPTGYPTYIMLGKLFTYLPVGDVAYRLNLASAVYAAVAVLLLFVVCLVLTGRIVPSAAAALLFGTSRTFWSQAVIAEVYTLNALFVSLTLLALLVWRRERRERYLLLAAFFAGLSMTHHMTSALLLPAGMLFVRLVERRSLSNLRLMSKAAGLFALGLSPYLYLPIRASMDPPLNETDPSTPARFVGLVTGQMFENRMFVFGVGDLPERLNMYAGYLQEQFHPAFLLVAVAGAVYMILKDRPGFALLCFLYAGWLVYALEYNIRDVYLYYIPTYLVISIFVAVGLAAAIEGVERVVRSGAPAARTVAVVSIPVLFLPLWGVGDTYRAVDRSWDYRGREILEAIAAGTEKDSTVLHNGSSLWYLTLVEGRRPDLRVVDPFPPGEWKTRTPLWAESAREYRRYGRVYILFPGTTAGGNVPYFDEAGYELVPDESGIFYEVVLKQRGMG